MSNAYLPSGSRAAMTSCVLLVATTFVAVAVNPFINALNRAKLAEDISNTRQVKLALDTFASDFDGVYPCEETADEVAEGLVMANHSNSYFRQLHLSGIADSEIIFWVEGASVCRKAPPDNRTKRNGQPVEKEILKRGDCGWAYVVDHDNTDSGSRPILLSAYRNGTKAFDRNLYQGKTIVMTLDGSVKALRLTPHGNVLDGDSRDIFSPEAAAWEGRAVDPATLLLQPLAKPKNKLRPKAKRRPRD